jgi:hypothetical protein
MMDTCTDMMCLVSIYMLCYTTLTQAQIRTITVPGISPEAFEELSRTHGSTLSCPCSMMTIAYRAFISHRIAFQPVCKSLFVTPQWIRSLYIAHASRYGTGDFRTTAHAQVRQTRLRCEIGKSPKLDCCLRFSLNFYHICVHCRKK